MAIPRLFIARLPDKVGKKRLTEYFLDHAHRIDRRSSIIDCFIPHGRGFAFITFSTPKVAKELLRQGDFIIDGDSVAVSAADPKSGARGGNGGGGRGNFATPMPMIRGGGGGGRDFGRRPFAQAHNQYYRDDFDEYNRMQRRNYYEYEQQMQQNAPVMPPIPSARSATGRYDYHDEYAAATQRGGGHYAYPTATDERGVVSGSGVWMSGRGAPGGGPEVGVPGSTNGGRSDPNNLPPEMMNAALQAFWSQVTSQSQQQGGGGGPRGDQV